MFTRLAFIGSPGFSFSVSRKLIANLGMWYQGFLRHQALVLCAAWLFFSGADCLKARKTCANDGFVLQSGFLA
jgi:hypothetical protein